MNLSIDGFYAVYMTGNAGQGFAMVVFRNGAIVGVDVSGVRYDGTYTVTNRRFAVRINVTFPPNTTLVQGVTTGPEGDISELEFQLPKDFISQPFIRIDAKHGPVNAKIVKLRELND
jgi:hypothetical protein